MAGADQEPPASDEWTAASVNGLTSSDRPAGGSSSGCEPEDFSRFSAGAIALMQRGTCNFAVKVANAISAGATGVLIFNEGDTPDRTGPISGTLESYAASIPVLGTSFAVGDALRDGVLNGPTGATVRIVTNGDGPTPAPPDEQLEDLIAAVRAMGLAEGTERALTSQLERSGNLGREPWCETAAFGRGRHTIRIGLPTTSI